MALVKLATYFGHCPGIGIDMHLMMLSEVGLVHLDADRLKRTAPVPCHGAIACNSCGLNVHGFYLLLNTFNWSCAIISKDVQALRKPLRQHP